MNDEDRNTERARFGFRVLQAGENNTPWITMDPIEGNLDAVDGFLGFELVSGTSYEKAKEIAKYMSDHIEFITCTTGPDDAETL